MKKDHGKKIWIILDIIILGGALFLLFFMSIETITNYYVIATHKFDDESIIKYINDDELLQSTIGFVFFGDETINDDNKSVEFENPLTKEMVTAHYESDDWRTEYISISVNAVKKVNGIPVERVSGNAIIDLYREKKKKSAWTYTGATRDLFEPVYQCLDLPKEPGDLDELKDIEDRIVGGLSVNEAKNRITVRYEEKEKSSFIEDTVIRERELLYHGYDDTWVQEMPDRIVERCDVKKTLFGNYSCSYNGFPFEIVIEENDSGKTDWTARLKYKNERVRIQTIYTDQSVERLKYGVIEDILKRYDGKILSAKTPKSFIEIIIAPDERNVIGSGEKSIYLVFDGDQVYGLLPDPDKKERLARVEMEKR